MDKEFGDDIKEIREAIRDLQQLIDRTNLEADVKAQIVSDLAIAEAKLIKIRDSF